MTLSEFRQFFKEFSGRYNLPDTDLNALINSGGKLLSSQLVGHYGEAFHMAGVDADNDFLDVTKYLTSVHAVFTVGSVGAVDRNYVALKGYGSFEDFLEAFPTKTSGQPTAYTLVPPLVIANAQDISTSVLAAERWSAELFRTANPVLILFNTTMPERVDFRIIGRAQVRKLIEDDDSNYLTQQNPILLAHAALYMLELKMRQYQEAAAIQSTLSTLIQSEMINSIGIRANQMDNMVL